MCLYNIGEIKLQKKILKLNPSYVFTIVFVYLFIISEQLLKNVSTLYLIYIIAFNIIFFSLYTLIRYIEYLVIYPWCKALLYLFIDNGLMIIDLSIFYSVEYFLYRGTGIINFYLYILVICLLIPSYFRNVALKQNWLSK